MNTIPYPINSFVIGDALKFLKSLPDQCVPMFLFSPPYNLKTGEHGGIKRNNHPTTKWKNPALADGYADHDDAMEPKEYIAWQKQILSECWRCLTGEGAIFYNHKPTIRDGEYHTPLDYNPDLPVHQIIIWSRNGGFNYMLSRYMPMHEWIVVYAKSDFKLKSKGASGVGDVWNITPEINTWHPAPFPLALAERAIETVMPDLVVDPFAGSGTVATAAKRLGVNYLCNELTAAYVEKAKKRVDRERFRPKLFEDTPDQVQMAFA